MGAWAQTTKRPASGDGKVNNPFLISTAAELAWFRDHVNEDYANVKASAKLIADIDLSEFCHAANASENIIAKSWEPIGNSKDNTKALSTEMGRPSPTFISMQNKNIWDFSVIPMKVQSRT